MNNTSAGSIYKYCYHTNQFKENCYCYICMMDDRLKSLEKRITELYDLVKEVKYE